MQVDVVYLQLGDTSDVSDDAGQVGNIAGQVSATVPDVSDDGEHVSGGSGNIGSVVR